MSAPDDSVPAEPALSHVVSEGGRSAARMVDVRGKPVTERRALARATVELPAGTLAGILAGDGPKGPITEVARTAGILAAKRTGELIPLCHPLGLELVEIHFAELAGDVLEVRCATACSGRTGVEMEAMVGASVAALTVYDMVKALDKGVRLGGIELLEKSGGKSGPWRRA